jgi:hypothetical protein
MFLKYILTKTCNPYFIKKWMAFEEQFFKESRVCVLSRQDGLN